MIARVRSGMVGGSPRLRYTPSLDGVRAIAVLLVFAFHVPGTWWYLPNGSLGVDLFFVLSGFLITSLLVEEHQATGRIDLPKFYMRRALRLFPALIVTLIAVALLIPTEDASIRGDIVKEIVTAGTYTTNWFLAFDALDSVYLEHTWSLALEEQYYLIWAIAVVGLMATFRKAERIVLVALLVAALSILWRVVLLIGFDASFDRVYFGFDTRLDGLLLGSALGAFRHTAHGLTVAGLARHRAAPAVAAGASLLLVAMSAVEWPGNVVRFAILLPMVNVAAAVITVQLVDGESSLLSRMLSSAPLVRVGKLSYGIYLFHIPVIRVLRRSIDPSPEVLFVLAIAVTYVLAEASYRAIEKPLLLQKSRFRSIEGVGSSAGVNR